VIYIAPKSQKRIRAHWGCPRSHYKGTIHAVHAMNAEQHQTAADLVMYNSLENKVQW